MKIKIESGANVQITDKPIYNIHGDVVQQKIVAPPIPQRAAPKEKSPKKTSDEVVKTSFAYNPTGITDESKNIRLSEVFNLMRAHGLIDKDSSLKEFLQVFSGESVTVRIAWTGSDNVLHYLFDEWVNARKYVPKPRGGLWKTVAARFYYRGKDKDGVYCDEDYTADELRKTANPVNPSDDLEFILELLKPDLRTRRYGE